MEYKELIIHKPDATQANNMPRGSIVNCNGSPGIISKNLIDGIFPFKTALSNEVTSKNNIIPVRRVIDSLKLGCLLHIKMPIPPTRGVMSVRSRIVSRLINPNLKTYWQPCWQ
jgi:hypothetical protein